MCGCCWHYNHGFRKVEKVLALKEKGSSSPFTDKLYLFYWQRMIWPASFPHFSINAVFKPVDQIIIKKGCHKSKKDISISNKASGSIISIAVLLGDQETFLASLADNKSILYANAYLWGLAAIKAEKQNTLDQEIQVKNQN